MCVCLLEILENLFFLFAVDQDYVLAVAFFIVFCCFFFNSFLRMYEKDAVRMEVLEFEDDSVSVFFFILKIHYIQNQLVSNERR